MPVFIQVDAPDPNGTCQAGCAAGKTCVSGACMSCGGYGEPCCAGSCLAGATCLGGCCGRHTFYDDFSQGLDTGKWIVLNSEPNTDSYWRGVNTTVDSGMLKLTAKVDPTGFNGYSSGSIATHQWFGYGRYRITAKVTAQPGLVPAFWFSGHNCSEIDVFEGGGLCGYNPAKMFFGHYPQTQPEPGETTCKPARQVDYEHTAAVPYALSFRVYELDWSPNRILISIDGVPMYSATANIPPPPMQLLLNLNVEAGGLGWPENQVGTGTQFPSTFLIDKVEGWTPALTCPVVSNAGAWSAESEPSRTWPLCCHPGTDGCPELPGELQSKAACVTRPRDTR
ncbi:family 16 glycosylhydrolase [Myxococcus llanfairpwllgwyngyllgogerychwyrndrobwllllantysiliogogogochensis]|uniref:glycoside hydrolase family 16 protein n=1 Tax=Myxococcus TaxID=32 RepID=UPI00157A298D|nr:glycoside hydrolase family 16 protein [Myxococcus llanfairpwllgwyngyllgogerychwyrndrobwllllantysiliogogogochensis]NTX08055.1 glycoside hydrolase family 16 protein [Myxococcus sp. CA040A]